MNSKKYSIKVIHKWSGKDTGEVADVTGRPIGEGYFAVKNSYAGYSLYHEKSGWPVSLGIRTLKKCRDAVAEMAELNIDGRTMAVMSYEEITGTGMAEFVSQHLAIISKYRS